MTMQLIDLRVITSAGLLATLICASAGLANPTGADPNAALAAHGTIPGASELVTSLYALYNEEEQACLQQYAKRETPQKLSDRVIAKAAGRLFKGRRDAEHLKLMGEPAGADLSAKMHPLFLEFGNLAGAYRGTPRGQQLVAKIKTKLQRELPRLKKFLQQAEAALQRGKLEVFEKQMESKGNELHSQIIFLLSSEKRPYIEPFNAVLLKGDELLRKKRKQEYMDQAKAAMSKQVAAAAEMTSEATRIRNELVAGGTAKLGDGKTGGPVEAFTHVAGLWGNASAGLVRATAIVWAFTDRAKANIQPTPQQLKENAIASLASIIEAAAASTPPDKVQQVYSDLLKEITVMDRRLGSFSRDVSNGCESALGKLAAKDPTLSTRLVSYQRATSEPLNWRKMFASQHVRSLGRGLRESSALLSAETELPSNNRPPFSRQPRGKTVIAPSSFGTPANWMVSEAAVRLLKQPVAVDGMLRLTPTSRTAVIPFQGNHYGNAPVAMKSEAEVADLKTAVVVDDNHGPLSIEAADAVSSADMHDYMAVAGPIRQVHLEALLTRFVSLPDVAYTLAPFGTTLALDENTSPLQQTCWRLDVQPVWARNKYFTVVNPSK